MKKIILLSAVASVLILQSCSESAECKCMQDTVDALKEAWESNYEKTLLGAMDSPNCIEVSQNMNGRSKSEQDAEVKKMGKCSAHSDLKKEQKLYQEHLQKEFEKQLDDAMSDYKYKNG
jgi:hypothetical protein